MARLEVVRMFLAFAAHSNFKVYQMDVKSAFLNGELEEEVYLEQPPGFEDSEFSDFVYFFSKLSMALSKHLGHGMTLSLNFCLKMVLREVL